MSVLKIGEARRRLSELVRKVAAGHEPVAIGRRGRCEALLVPAARVAAPLQRRSLIGLIEVVGDLQTGELAARDIDTEITRSLDRTERLITGELVARPKRKPSQRAAPRRARSRTRDGRSQ